jgi:hypothetical protein
VNLFPSFMRTLVPIAAGALLTLAAKTGIDLDSGTSTTVATAILTAAYYLAFRLLEETGNRIGNTPLRKLAGILLGWARPPQYPPLTTPAKAAAEANA